MADEFPIPTSPASEPRPWLAGNRKVIILGAAALLIVALGVGVAMAFRKPATNTGTLNTNGDGPNVIVVNTPTGQRPTFQRSTVVNTSTTLPPAYTPPSRTDLQRAIDKLTNQSNP